jgi:glucose/arabinose dehydrogenase
MKWLGYVLGAAGLVALGLFLYVKLFVGAINAPLGTSPADEKGLLARLTTPDGFSVGIYARVDNARVLRFSNGGHLLVANPSKDQITILDPDVDGDRRSDNSRILIDGLNGPNGIDFLDDWLYIAETDAIGRVAFDHNTGQLSGSYERLVTGLPAGENHWKKTLRFGPDGLMYVTMGSSCNACIESDPRRGAMVRYQSDGTGEEIFAEGLRNSAGFDWSPVDGEIYATDNGRDLLGDDFPPCELNLVRAGEHYGWPYANGAKIPDPDFGAGNEALIARSLAPAFDFPAHNAPLGIEFARGDRFPESHRNAAIVALHGSWNRTEKDGYKVVSLHWNEDGTIRSEDFLSGFLKDDVAIGRPAEVTEGPDGAFYISDDYANVVYRVAYGEAQSAESLEIVVAAPRFNVQASLADLNDAQIVEAQAAGEAVFNRYQCIGCHADQGRALKKLENLGNKYDVPALTEYLRRPTAPMPVFPLSDAQRESLAIYLLTRYPGENSE